MTQRDYRMFNAESFFEETASRAEAALILRFFSGASNTFQKQSCSSAASDATVVPSGESAICSTRFLWCANSETSILVGARAGRSYSVRVMHTGKAHHGGVLPDGELVLREAVRGDQLALMRRPEQRRHLRVGVDRVDKRARLRVPNLNATVRGTAASGQRVRLPGAPSQSLHGRLMAVEGEARCGGARVPQVHHVVVAARGEHGAVG